MESAATAPHGQLAVMGSDNLHEWTFQSNRTVESSEPNVEEEKPVPKRERLEANNVEVIVKQAKLCDQCGAQMKKKRYWACPNKCGKN
ncbi:hypothetical protein BpHYR1_015991 [Brachionus plicatilis]|uniref:Uncharacterized protein n=1 Tax=Brachionus plicatilis TaxID=10195 RepID=A0A3M7PBW4_BRAPC|nr:hypothetical protein BpHYR1_015991 [Brachionus plicatilis]